MSVALPDVDDVPRNIRGDHKDGALVSSDVKAFPLADRVELRAVVPSDNLSERILLVSCLLDVLFPSPVGLSLELDVIVPYRF